MRRAYGPRIERHLHTLEIIAVSAFSTAVLFHVFRYIGGKLVTTQAAPVGKGLLGVFSFPAPTP